MITNTSESATDMITNPETRVVSSNNNWIKPMKNYIQLKFVGIRNAITVEPLIACYVMAAIVCGPALYNLEFEKACRVNLRQTDTVCEQILSGNEHNYTEINQHVQVLISNMHSWQSPLQSVTPLVLILFLGAYSDRHRIRRPFMLLPLIGELLACFGCALCVAFRQWPLEAQAIAQTVVPSLFGGQAMLVMAAFAYIADVSSLEMRTWRIGALQLVLNVCTPLAQSFSGLLYSELGYYGVLLFAGVLYGIALLYGTLCIREKTTAAVSHVSSVVPTKTQRFYNHLRDIFDPKHAIATFQLLWSRNSLAICTIMFVLFVYSTVVSGEGSVFYLYAQSVFHWTPLEYSYFITANTIIHLIGTLLILYKMPSFVIELTATLIDYKIDGTDALQIFKKGTSLGIPLLSNVLKLNDWYLLVLTFIDKIITNLVLGLARTVTVLYAGLIVSLITGITTIAIRSLATKVVSPEDLGKAQSLFGICEALGPAIAVPIYNRGIYINTLEVLPAAYFFFGTVLLTLSIVIIIYLYYYMNREEKRISGTHNSTTRNQTDDIIEITHI